MTPEQYCQQRAAPRGSSLYYSLRYADREQRAALTAVFALHDELLEIPRECHDPGVARTKLDYWHEELAQLQHGQARHPVARALSQAVARYRLPEEYFAELLDGAEMDLQHYDYADLRELSLYCHRVGGVLGTLATEILGYSDRHTTKFGHALGMAMAMDDRLRALRADAGRGRIYVPADERAQHGVRAEELMQPQTSDRLRALLTAQWQRVGEWYERALDLLPEADRGHQRPLLVEAALRQTLLNEIERDGLQLMEHQVALTPLRKLWLAWRTARTLPRRNPAA